MASLDFINSKKLSARITELKEELAHLLDLEKYVSPKPKRGRPAASAPAKASTKRTRKRQKRGALGEQITKYLGSKGKEGAHVKDIASHLKSKPANVTAWIYSTGKGKVKKMKPGTFALKD